MALYGLEEGPSQASARHLPPGQKAAKRKGPRGRRALWGWGWTKDLRFSDLLSHQHLSASPALGKESPWHRTGEQEWWWMMVAKAAADYRFPGEDLGAGLGHRGTLRPLGHLKLRP